MPWVFIRPAVWLSGGTAVRITPRRPRSLEGMHGLILSGGSDIAPELYGQEPLISQEAERAGKRRHWTRLFNVLVALIVYGARFVFGLKRSPEADPERDTLETNLLREAVERNLPVLGICRGMQMINIFFGGSLHQEIAEFYGETARPRTVLPYSRIRIEPESRLARIFGRTRMKVNGLNHQAVDRLGADLTAVAFDNGDVIQAIEHTTRPLVIGVQWHPEFLPQLPIQRKLFEHLVKEARKAAETEEANETGNEEERVGG